MIMMQNRDVYFRLKGSKDINPKSQGKDEPQISHLNSKWFSGLKKKKKKKSIEGSLRFSPRMLF